MPRRRRWLAAALVVGTQFATPVLAGDGRVEISHASVIASGGYPFVIAQPGSYLLTSNLQVPEGETAIELATSEVSLDLNGFRIAGPTGCSGGDCAGAAIESVGLANGHHVTLRNGIIRGFAGTCVALRDFAHVRGIDVSECGGDGISVGRWALIVENRVSTTGEDGIRMADGSSSYAHNVVSGAGQNAPGVGVVRGKASAGNSCDDGSCTSDGSKRYYLTVPGFAGNHGADDCAAGFHMASMFEILDTSNLTYDQSRGRVHADSGSGPPSLAVGWVRSGSSPFGPSCPGIAGDPWANNSVPVEGLTARVHVDPGSEGKVGWETLHLGCQLSLPLWCIED